MRTMLVLASVLLTIFSAAALVPTAAAHYEEACGGDLHLRCADCRGWGMDESGEMVCKTRGDCFVYALDDCYLDRP